MARFIAATARFAEGEEGATMLEYALMAALIAAVCVGVVGSLGLAVQLKFSDLNTAL